MSISGAVAIIIAKYDSLAQGQAVSFRGGALGMLGIEDPRAAFYISKTFGNGDEERDIAMLDGVVVGVLDLNLDAVAGMGFDGVLPSMIFGFGEPSLGANDVICGCYCICGGTGGVVKGIIGGLAAASQASYAANHD